MGIFGNNRVDEASKWFKTKLKPTKNKEVTGEGYEDMNMSAQSLVDTLSSFNIFNNNYINNKNKNEVTKIYEYREMMAHPEISDVVEDAIIESTQEFKDGNIFDLEILDEDIAGNKNKTQLIHHEFNELFNNRLKLNKNIWDWVYSYYVDGRVFIERIGRNNNGIVSMKKLPAETMDYKIGVNGKIEFFVQYLKKNCQLPNTIEDAEKDPNMVAFYPQQISYIDFGLYGKNKKEVFGFLEKCKQPFNQLKLLETAVIIYRIIRAPERLVFRIDTGSMPREKALKYVEKLKKKFTQQEAYDPNTGQIANKTAITCIRKNTEIPLLDGRYLTLEEIIEEYKMGKENWVYSINNESGIIEPGKIINADITRYNEKLVRVWLDDGSYVDTTYDHKFIMRDGSEKRADELQENDSLMPLYRKDGKIGNHYYDMMYQPSLNKWEFTHTSVSSYFNGKRNENEITHHNDYNPKNNDPNNLYRMGRDDHLRLHQNNVWARDREKMMEACRKGRMTLKNDKEKWSKFIKQSDCKTYSKYRDNLKNTSKNHKVTKVEFLSETDDTGCITVEGNHNFAISQNGKSLIFIHNSLLESYFIPQSADGRGSQIESIGGNFSAFSELDDIYFFQKKLYRALKYPMSRVVQMHEGRDGDITFGGDRIGSIARDEIKWAKFLERQQNRFCFDLKEVFLLHLEFKGIKKEYELNFSTFKLRMKDPNHYKMHIEQMIIEQKQNNYQNFSNSSEFPKSYLMREFLDYDEEDFEKIKSGFEDDKKYFPKDEGGRW